MSWQYDDVSYCSVTISAAKLWQSVNLVCGAGGCSGWQCPDLLPAAPVCASCMQTAEESQIGSPLCCTELGQGTKILPRGCPIVSPKLYHCIIVFGRHESLSPWIMHDFALQGMQISPNGPHLISSFIEDSLGMDCSVLMGANIAEVQG